MVNVDWEAALMRILKVLALLSLTAPVQASPYLERGDDLALYLAENPPNIAILGEIHDNRAHHLAQARALAALQPKAVVFEMLTPEQAAALAQTDPRDAANLRRRSGWDESGWPDFALYAPVFAQVPKGGIRGAALSRDALRAAMSEGAAHVFGPEARAFGLSQRLGDTARQHLAAELNDAHCGAMPEAMLPGMIEAQRLRDAAFARAVLAAYRETGGPVALITGTGHARKDRGVPAALHSAAPELRLFVLGQGEAAPGQTPDPAEEALYDLLELTPPVPRPDPCAALRP